MDPDKDCSVRLRWSCNEDESKSSGGNRRDCFVAESTPYGGTPRNESGSKSSGGNRRDCFVAVLLAMTVKVR